MPTTTPPLPALWHEPAPPHFDLRLPWWQKSLLVLAATVLAIFLIDQPLAQWCDAHRIPDLMYKPKLVVPPLGGSLESSVATPSTSPDQTTSIENRKSKIGGGENPPPAPKSYNDPGRELMFLEQFGQFACTILVILTVALLDPKGRRRALAIAIACLLTVALTHLLKDLAGRSRPFNLDVPNSSDGHWEFRGPWWGFHKGSAWGSFPSAHTTAAFALASSLAWFYPKARPLFILLATITATQRVWHTAHYLSDALAGMGIGVFVARATLAQKLPGRLLALAPPNARAWWLQDTPPTS